MGLFSRGRSVLDIYEDEQRSLTRAQQPWPVYGTITSTDLGPDAAMAISDCFACVRLLSDTAASLPLVAYRRLADGDRERFSGRLTDLLATPSPGSVTANLIGTAVAHLSLHGNAYIGKYGYADGIVAQLAPLRPKGMTVTLREGVPQYLYVDQNGAMELGTADVLHLKALSLTASLGRRRSRSPRGARAGSEPRQARRHRSPRTPGRPGGVLRVPVALGAGHRARGHPLGLGAQVRRHRQRGQAVTPRRRRGRDLHAIRPSMADAEFVAQRQLSTQEIARIFRSPLHLIGAPLAHALTYANAEWESMEFLKFSIGPILRLIETAITADPDLSPSTVFCEFALDDLLRADSLTRAQVYEKGLADGWLTVEEVRQRENLPRLPATLAPAPEPQLPTTPAPPRARRRRRPTTPEAPMPDRPVPGQLEERSESISVDGRRIRGLIPFGVESRDLGGFREVIEPSALRGADLSELVATVEHRGLPLGRFPTTLAIEERADGAHWSVDPPATRQDVVEAIQRGDLRAGSWRMRVARDEWRGDVRHVHEIAALRDVAIVTSPAYPAASVEMRWQSRGGQRANRDGRRGHPDRNPARDLLGGHGGPHRSSGARQAGCASRTGTPQRRDEGSPTSSAPAASRARSRRCRGRNTSARCHVVGDGRRDDSDPPRRRPLGFDQRYAWPAFGRDRRRR